MRQLGKQFGRIFFGLVVGYGRLLFVTINGTFKFLKLLGQNFMHIDDMHQEGFCI